MADKWPILCNGEDISRMVDFSQYRTSVEPVYSDTITTLDKVDHFYKIRDRGILPLAFNSLTAADTAKLCALLLNAPVEMEYHCMQRHKTVKARMRLDSLSSQKIHKMQLGNQPWAETDSITLREL